MIEALIYGVVQGIAEFLPISSSAHLIIVSWLLEGKTLPLEINIALHFGTAMAVLVCFFPRWWSLAKEALKAIKTREAKTFESRFLLPALVLGSIPAGVAGLLGNDWFEENFHHPSATAIPLILGGVLLWWFDKTRPNQRTITEMRWSDVLWIGLMQTLALFPGMSRSGSTLIAARLLGLKRQDAVEFSFLLGTPLMFGAALLEARHMVPHLSNPNFYVGIVTSFVVGIVTIRGLLGFVSRFSLLSFAVYRVIIGALLMTL
jgi:undecaprenyl-diphosphatase